MKTALFCSMIVLGAMPLAASAEEVSSSFSWGDVTFQPRVYAGYANYELKSSNFNFIKENGETITRPIGFFWSPGDTNKEISNIQFSGILGGIGGTIASGPFFGDFYYQSTLNETAYSSQEVAILDPKVNINYGDGNAKHADWALSLGYMITDHWSVFAGYKSGNTEWDQTIIEHSYVQDATQKIDGSFEQNGPFLGASYSFQIGPGALTFRAAYAYLDGTEKMAINAEADRGNSEYSEYLQHQLDGNSNAFSLGISWTQSLADNLGVSINANYHRYKFDLTGGGQSSYQVENGTGKTVPPIDITGGSLTEDLFTLTASMFYRF